MACSAGVSAAAGHVLVEVADPEGQPRRPGAPPRGRRVGLQLGAVVARIEPRVRRTSRDPRPQVHAADVEDPPGGPVPVLPGRETSFGVLAVVEGRERHVGGPQPLEHRPAGEHQRPDDPRPRDSGSRPTDDQTCGEEESPGGQRAPAATGPPGAGRGPGLSLLQEERHRSPQRGPHVGVVGEDPQARDEAASRLGRLPQGPAHAGLGVVVDGRVEERVHDAWASRPGCARRAVE